MPFVTDAKLGDQSRVSWMLQILVRAAARREEETEVQRVL